MRLAQINNGEVVNIILADTKMEGYLTCPDAVQIGWRGHGGEFHAPSVPLDEIKAAKIHELTTAFNTDLNAGFESSALGSTHRYDSEQHNRENLIGAVATGVPQLFTCDDGRGNAEGKAQRQHTPAQLKQVLIDGAARKQALIARLREKRAAVLAATTETQVNAIAWQD